MCFETAVSGLLSVDPKKVAGPKGKKPTTKKRQHANTYLRPEVALLPQHARFWWSWWIWWRLYAFKAFSIRLKRDDVSLFGHRQCLFFIATVFARRERSLQ